MPIFIKSFIKEPFTNNNYVVVDFDTKEAVLIDCSWPDDEIMDWAKDQGVSIKYILLTHGHFDHVLGVNYYREKYGIDSYLFEQELPSLEKVERYAEHFQIPHSDKVVVQPYDLSQKFYVGSYPIEIICTPGHTVGGVCYLIDGNLFSGDTLFHGTCGRTDLAGGDEEKMQASLAMLFKKLPDETSVYPGHGAATTIGHERWLY